MASTQGNTNILFVAPQSAIATGSAFVGADAVRIRAGLSLNVNPGSLADPLLNSSLTQTSVRTGVRVAAGTIPTTMMPPSAAGVAPDCSLLLESLFGKAPTIVSGVSVRYTIDDAIRLVSILDSVKPDTSNQRVFLGATSDSVQFVATQESLNVDFTMSARDVINSASFAGLETARRGGYSGFPTVTGAPVTNAGHLTGIEGRLLWNGNRVSDITAATIGLNRQVERATNTLFNGPFAAAPVPGVRQGTFSFTAQEVDEANYLAMIADGDSDEYRPLILEVGKVGQLGVRFELPYSKLDPSNRQLNGQITTNDWTGTFIGTSAGLDEFALEYRIIA